jgi:hypothetical protein
MHALSSGALEGIRGMARCALLALESPRGVGDLQSIAEVLQAIVTNADQGHNDVDCVAEEAGVKVQDSAWMARLHAMHDGKRKGAASMLEQSCTEATQVGRA